MTRFALTSQRQGTCLTIAVEGELDLATAPELIEALGAAPDELVVVDLTRASFMDSTGLRTLLDAERRAKMAGSRLVVVCDGDGPVRRLFTITGLDDWAPLVRSRPVSPAVAPS